MELELNLPKLSDPKLSGPSTNLMWKYRCSQICDGIVWRIWYATVTTAKTTIETRVPRCGH
jgi:hypothetical protein